MMHQQNVVGVISAGGSGGTAIVTPAMQTLPVGVPKVMVSTMAAGICVRVRRPDRHLR